MNKFLAFMRDSVSSYHAVQNMENMLIESGFLKLEENKSWRLEFNKKYYICRNNSAIIAFTTPSEKVYNGINMSASHSDSPSFKVKPKCLINDGNYVRLNTEVYGGPILSTWLDRPLSLAGRVVVKGNGRIKTRLVYIDKDLLVIPNVAPHLMPEVNNGLKYNAQINMLPVLGLNSESLDLNAILAKELMCSQSDILDFDLFLVNRQRIKTLGYNDNLVISPQLDDLASAYACLTGFLNAQNKTSFNLFVCFDNEEVGSRTRQGAGSCFLEDTISRMLENLGYNAEEKMIVAANSFLISADNAHATNPNVPGLCDPLNKTYLNQGVVIKYNANQSYTTDSLSASYILSVAKKLGLNIQTYTNRSDVRGGSTLGAILLGKYSIHSVDIGIPQFAMHSASEVCAISDVSDTIKLLEGFYNNSIIIENDNEIVIR